MSTFLFNSSISLKYRFRKTMGHAPLFTDCIPTSLFYVTANNTLHKKYLLRILRGLPSSLGSLDTHRVILTYFAISGLDLLNELDSIPNKQYVIEWLYSLQVCDDAELVSGFQGSATLNTKLNFGQNALYKWGHIATTYSALATLVILGDDLERIHRASIIRSR
jgi:geranylgeranyl transferase type-1 subunit beta